MYSLKQRFTGYVGTASLAASILNWNSLLLPVIKIVAPKAIAAAVPAIIPGVTPVLGLIGLVLLAKKTRDSYLDMCKHNSKLDTITTRREHYK